MVNTIETLFILFVFNSYTYCFIHGIELFKLLYIGKLILAKRASEIKQIDKIGRIGREII